MPLTQPAIRLLAITTLAPLTVVALTAGLGSAAPATRPATTVPVGVAFFTQRIAPVLKEQCYPCHHADTPVSSYKGGLLLDNLAGMLKGGDSKEPAIVPGHPDTWYRSSRNVDVGWRSAIALAWDLSRWTGRRT